MTDSSSAGWEPNTIEKVLLETIIEQRRARRWRIFFRLLLIVVLASLVWLVFFGSPAGLGSHTAVINIQGVILENMKANAQAINEGLSAAFEDKNTQGIVLNINSPGGSAVQAGEVYDHLVHLRKENPQVKVYAVCSDLCASGAYYIAAAADEIYANKASLVGSIGVISKGFGFVDTLEKLGMTRRVVTAGENKDFLDPFKPLEENEAQHLKTILNTVHQQFITAVKQGRGDRLVDNPQLFSGLIWDGENALKYGLIDGFGSVDYVAREIIKEENRVDYTSYSDLWHKLSDSISSTMANHVGIEKNTFGAPLMRYTG